MARKGLVLRSTTSITPSLATQEQPSQRCNHGRHCASPCLILILSLSRLAPPLPLQTLHLLSVYRRRQCRPLLPAVWADLLPTCLIVLRHHQDHLRDLPPSSRCLPRARMPYVTPPLSLAHQGLGSTALRRQSLYASSEAGWRDWRRQHAGRRAVGLS